MQFTNLLTTIGDIREEIDLAPEHANSDIWSYTHQLGFQKSFILPLLG